MFHRVLLKLSGEALSGEGERGFIKERVDFIVQEIAKVVDMGISLGVVLGGGNIYRGKQLEELSPIYADQIGILGTVMNSIYLKDYLERHCIRAVVFSSVVNLPAVFHHQYDEMNQYLENGFVVIFAGGTSNPLFTTDTAAALRAMEMSADLLVKATKVEGVFSEDPKIDPKAKKYDRISFNEVIRKGLSIMDLEAFSVCNRYKIPIQVINFFKEDNLFKTILGEHIGTLVYPD